MSDEVIYMIAGQDADGDQHMVMTESLDRVIMHYRTMAVTLRELRGNEAFETIARPLIETLDH